MASDRKLVGHDPSWGILRNNLFCGEVIDWKDAPAMGLEAKRQTNILANHNNREKLHLTFISLFSGKKNLCVAAKTLTVPPPSPLSLPPPSQFIKDLLVKGARMCHSFLLLCQAYAASHRSSRVLSKLSKKLKTLMNLYCSVVDETKFFNFWWAISYY